MGRPRKYATPEEAEKARNERALANYYQNQEQQKQYKKEYYQRNREKILEQKRQQRLAEKEQYIEIIIPGPKDT